MHGRVKIANSSSMLLRDHERVVSGRGRGWAMADELHVLVDRDSCLALATRTRSRRSLADVLAGV